MLRSRPSGSRQIGVDGRTRVLARARFIEDLVEQQAGRGVEQYFILGAGLDTFAQRRPELASRLHVFEIDQPGPQAWKRRRVVELGFGIPAFLRLVPVDFEAGDAWWERLVAAGVDPGRPAVVASAGVSMYLTREAIAALLGQVAALAPGSTLVMTFMLPVELADPELRPGLEQAAKGARAAGTPFLSFLTPAEMLKLARRAGFRRIEHVPAAALAERYFAGRTDGLRAPNIGRAAGRHDLIRRSPGIPHHPTLSQLHAAPRTQRWKSATKGSRTPRWQVAGPPTLDSTGCRPEESAERLADREGPRPIERRPFR